MRDETKKPKFILHIGGPKSGSSAIQRYLFFNRYKLEKAGFLYIDKNFEVNQNECISHNHMLDSLLRISYDDLKSKFKKLSKNQQDKTFLFSSEGLCRIKNQEEFSKKFSLLKEFFDVKIILYIRNQGEFIYSGYQQWGVPKNLSFEDWVEIALMENRANWYKIVLAWNKYFDFNDFRVKVYHPDNLLNGDIIDDFIKLTGIPCIKNKVPNKANYTFPDASVKLLMSYTKYKNIEIENLLLNLKKQPPEFLMVKKENLYFSEQLQKRVYDYYQEDNNYLFKELKLDQVSINYFTTPRIKKYAISLDNINHQEVFQKLDNLLKG